MTMKNDFASEERRCELLFLSLCPCWHLYTPENHPVIFTDEADYKAAMTLIALCSLCFPAVRILTFQWMSNHLHITLTGPEEDVTALFTMLKRYLKNYLKSIQRAETLEGWTCKIRRIDNLKDLRNVITYNNRNGFLVNRSYTPFNYPWGANRYFFNPDAKIRFRECKETIRLKTIRDITRSHKFDGFVGKPFLDGIVPPMTFCDITTTEALFRNPRQYFSLISRNIEGMKAIADEIGESVYYTDDDLFAAVIGICQEQYNVRQPSLLPAAAKMDVARRMHFEYNAAPKQIARILKVDLSILGSIFPTMDKRSLP